MILADEDFETDQATLTGTPTRILGELERYANAGLTHLVAGISHSGGADYEAVCDTLERVAAEILPTARSL
mgnify:CR=1 FL=1